MAFLYIVSTPIGNLKDITQRALEVLKEVDLILAENTRQALKILNHYNIKKPLINYFEHSNFQKIQYIVDQLKKEKKLALISEAGTPGISDPGNKLIRYIVSLKELRVKIVPIPGPNAIITALSVSGFSADKFVFMGFPPTKKRRDKFFEELVNLKYTVVFYESCHRILKTLEDLQKKFQFFNLNYREIVICRELTKKHESIYRGKIDEIIEILKSDKNNLKGEFVIILNKR